jgi:hypothetical protein
MKMQLVKSLWGDQQFRAFRKKQLGSLGVLFGVQNALSLYYQELL